MTQIDTGYELLTSVEDVRPGVWSSPQNVLYVEDPQLEETFGYASTWDTYSSGKELALRMTLPKLSLPGGIPVSDAITVDEVWLEVRWKRQDNPTAGGRVQLEGINIENYDFIDQFAGQWSRDANQTTMGSDFIGGDATFWKTGPNQLKDFVNGDLYASVRFQQDSINGSVLKAVNYIKARILYTYVGGGTTTAPRLF